MRFLLKSEQVIMKLFDMNKEIGSAISQTVVSMIRPPTLVHQLQAEKKIHLLVLVLPCFRIAFFCMQYVTLFCLKITIAPLSISIS